MIFALRVGESRFALSSVGPVVQTLVGPRTSLILGILPLLVYIHGHHIGVEYDISCFVLIFIIKKIAICSLLIKTYKIEKLCAVMGAAGKLIVIDSCKRQACVIYMLIIY